jgi:hypothetical protein
MDNPVEEENNNELPGANVVLERERMGSRSHDSPLVEHTNQKHLLSRAQPAPD